MGRRGLAVVDRLAVKPACTIGGAYEGTAHDASETECACLVREFDKLLGLDPALDRMMARRRPEVLRDRDDLDTGIVEIGERFADLRTGLAHAEDQIGLGDETSCP